MAKPDYNVSAKYEAKKPDDPNSKDRYVNIGVGWNSTTADGAPCIHVKLNAKPWSEWDGSLTLFQVRG